MSGPLQHLVVVEFAALGPVPLAGQLLADLGAQVIIVDRVSAAADETDINRRNKKSVALNLKHQQGLSAAKKLIAGADILLEGYRPGVMEKLGLGPADLHTIRPSLIYGRMTGWGQQGPLSPYAGHDINYLALSGALHTIGHKSLPPVPPLNLVADYGGGALFLIMGVLSALYERSHSGEGQVIDAAMVDGVPAMMGLIHSLFAQQSWLTERESNMLDGGAPYYRCYETQDNKYIAVGAIESQFFAVFLQLAGLPATDTAIQHDRSQWHDMHRRYATHFKSKTRQEWEHVFAGSDACVTPVLDFNEVSQHPHNQARGVFITPQSVLQSAPAPRFDRTPVSVPTAPEAAGGSTTELLGSCGLSDEQIREMLVSGAIT